MLWLISYRYSRLYISPACELDTENPHALSEYYR
jgi:hypothetical protein